MATTSAERQALWRGRVALRELFFIDLNAQRVERIKSGWGGDDRPEAKALLDFFVNYPRCETAPTLALDDQKGWLVCLPNGSAFEGAAAVVALREITSLPIEVTSMAPAEMRAYPGLVDKVRREVAEMRTLGLWGQA